MILHLGDDVCVHTADIIAIIDLTDSHSAVTGAMLHDIRRQNRILARQGITDRQNTFLPARSARFAKVFFTTAPSI